MTSILPEKLARMLIMSDAKEFEMSDADLKELLEACKSVPYLVMGGMEPRSPQQNANDAWARLGKRMGFDSTTVEASEKGNKFFWAVPCKVD